MNSKNLGFDPTISAYTMPMPSNMHTHFRHPSDTRFPIAVEAASRLYQHATAMPNLGKHFLIRSPDGALAYKKAIEEYGRRFNPHFTVNVPLYLEPTTKPETVQDGYKAGAWIAAKLYPKGGTTASDDGVDFRNLNDLYPVFRVMEMLGMVLLVHAEPLYDKEGMMIDIFHRERRALDHLLTIMTLFPYLKIVFEHISTAEGATFVKKWMDIGRPIEATIAPQYLLWTRNKLFEGGGMNPLHYSIPVLKEESDRLALIDFMLEGYGFLGTDSAPHLLPSKSKPCGCAGGVFNEPIGLYVYFDIFKTEGEKRGKSDWFDRFVDFACHSGPMLYGLQQEDVPMLMTIDPWQVPEMYGTGRDVIIPMLAGEMVKYRLKPSLLV